MSSRKSKANEISVNRIYEAPVKMVWEAWTDPKQVAQWWGPRGFTLTTQSKDVKAGGKWIYTMHGPDGVDYPNITLFHEVETYKRMVYDHGGNENQPPLFRVTVTFDEISSGKTEMKMTMALATAEAAAETRKFIKKAGGESTWDRLAEFLSSTDRFVINRSFEAPIALVFKMWTDPKHLVQWTAPAGSSMEYLEADVRPGGTSRYSMTAANGMKLYGKAQYREITPVHRLVYTQSFCDEKGGPGRHPMAPTWPETMLTTVVLTEEGDHATRVTITWEVYGDANEAERKTFHQAKGGMTQGWTGSLDKLEELLKK